MKAFSGFVGITKRRIRRRKIKRKWWILPHQIPRNVDFQRMVIKYDPSVTRIFSGIMNVTNNNLYFVTLVSRKRILKHTIKCRAVCSSIPDDRSANVKVLNIKHLKHYIRENLLGQKILQSNYIICFVIKPPQVDFSFSLKQKFLTICQKISRRFLGHSMFLDPKVRTSDMFVLTLWET